MKFLLIDKLLMLGGWFYISLIVLLIALVFPSQKIKKRFSVLILYTGAIFAISFSFSNFLNDSKELSLFFRSENEKIESTTFNQYSFAKEVRSIFNRNDEVCLLWSWDIPTKYLIQETYPVRTKIVMSLDMAIQKCDFVISQFNPRPELNKEPMLNYKNNYIYNLRGQI